MGRRIDAMDGNRREIVELGALLGRRIASLIHMPGEQTTAIPGLTLYCLTAPVACYAAEYETGMAIIVQGKKRVTLGRTTYICDELSFVLTSVEVPLISEILEATEKKPLLALFLKLDMSIIREIDREEFTRRGIRSDGRSAPLGQAKADLLQPCIRLLKILDTPSEIPFFSTLIQRELVYRLLQYPQGDFLRAMARLDAERKGAGKALAWLRANYMKPFRLEELAEIARMGVSTLNHHFHAVTALSPLQYQKHLRLIGARERMLVEGLDATRAALEVGYESTSQFTREYKRLFGQPPMRDIKTIRSSSTAA